jgi:hypothetical protein
MGKKEPKQLTVSPEEKSRETALDLLDCLERSGISSKQNSWIDCFADWEREEFREELQKAVDDALSSGNWLEVQEVIECWKETAGIVSDKELLAGLEESSEQINRGETIRWEDVKKKLDLE